MQVYGDHIEIWNEGGLPEGYTAETLMRKHSSRPRNKTIAAVMFRAGFIETWGRGYTKVRESFEREDYPMPIVTEIDGGVSVWIKRFSLDELVARNKNRYGDKAPNIGLAEIVNVGNNVGNVSVTKLSERQRNICLMIKKNPYVTVMEMSVALSVAKRTVERDLAAMVDVVKHDGKVNAGKWVLLKDFVG